MTVRAEKVAATWKKEPRIGMIITRTIAALQLNEQAVIMYVDGWIGRESCRLYLLFNLCSSVHIVAFDPTLCIFPLTWRSFTEQMLKTPLRFGVAVDEAIPF